MMTTTTESKNKPGRLTDSKWWFCEIGQHDCCATEIELASRFEGCPCDCHQTAPAQPAPESDGEWSEPYYVKGQGWLIADTQGCFAQVRNEKIARQIVSDHRTVPLLVAALKEVRNRHQKNAQSYDFNDCGCDDCATLKAALNAVDHQTGGE